MNFIKQIARNFVFPTIVGLGLEKIMTKSTRNNLLNIYYHGVVESDSNYFSPRHLHIEQFEEQIQYLKKNFDVISLKDAFDVKAGRIILEKPTVTISFDDGYQNNLNIALPILKKYDVKTTFFISGICTKSDQNSLLWTDIIAFAKHFCAKSEIELLGIKFVDFINVENKKSMKDFFKNKEPEYRDQAMIELIECCDVLNRLKNVPSEIWRLLSAKEIKELSNNKNIEIGSHGYNHYNLGGISIDKAINDMKRSKATLESAIEKPIDMICYPDGSYSKEIVDAAVDLGYAYSVCCDYISLEDSISPNIVNRYGISNTTTFASNAFFINKNFKMKGI